MKRSLICVAATGALTFGCATVEEEAIDEAAAAKLAEFERTGETVDCISLTRLARIEPVTEKTFLIKVGVNEYYVNDVSGRCNGATRSWNRLQYSTSLSSLCRNDLIRVIDNSGGFQVGGCGLGSYEKLRKKAQTEAEEN